MRNKVRQLKPGISCLSRIPSRIPLSRIPRIPGSTILDQSCLRACFRRLPRNSALPLMSTARRGSLGNVFRLLQDEI